MYDLALSGTIYSLFFPSQITNFHEHDEQIVNGLMKLLESNGHVRRPLGSNVGCMQCGGH
jgi:hypothetical protein